jgi:filamentous hemagglutinin
MAPKVHPWQLIRLLGPFWGTVAVLVLIGFSVWQTGRLPDFGRGAAGPNEPSQKSTVPKGSTTSEDVTRESTTSGKSTASHPDRDSEVISSVDDDGSTQPSENPRPSPAPQSSTTKTAQPNPPKKGAAEARESTDSSEAAGFIVRQVTIKDLDGEVAYQGDVDLTPTLVRIERGERHPHRNDGGTFRNLEGRLPRKSTGYYKEYVHPTPGLDGPGPQRVVLGAEGELYYTHDHYRTFKKLR